MAARPLWLLAVVSAAFQIASTVASTQDPTFTELSIAGRRVRVESREHNGKAYLRLADLQPLGLALTETQAGRVRVAGPDGSVDLRLGSSLVRERSRMTLLSAPVRRWDGQWFVPREFIERIATPLLGNSRIGVTEERGAPTARRSGPLLVEVLPDRVELSIRLDKPFELVVKEEERWIRLEVPPEAVLNRAPAVPPNDILSAVIPVRERDSSELRLVKGPGFTHVSPQRDAGSTRTVTLHGTVGELGRRGDSDLASRREDTELDLPPACDVVIDPGHGGADAGAAAGSLREKELMLGLALDVQQRLRRQGVCAEVLRRRDIAVGLQQRSAAANHLRPRLVLSLHVDASPLPGAVAYLHSGGSSGDSGSEPALASWDQAQRPHRVASRLLATQLLEELERATGRPGRTVSAPLALIASIDSPAVLLQVGSLGGRREPDELTGGGIVDAITAGIVRFLRSAARSGG